MSFAALILTGAAIAAFAASIASVICFRGRAIPGTHLCRKCAFDVQGLATTCPECGGDITSPKATRPARRRHKKLALCLALVAVLMASTAAAFGAAAALKNGANPYKPLWLLLIESRQPTTAGSAAIRELRKRDASGALSPSARSRILNTALAARRDESTTFNPLWADLIATHRELGNVSDADWIEFVKRGIRIEPSLKPKFRPGQSTPFSVNYSGPELPSGSTLRIPIVYVVDSVQVGGQEVERNVMDSRDTTVSRTNGGRSTWQVISRAPSGPASAEFRLSVKLLDVPGGREIAAWTVEKQQSIVLAHPGEEVVTSKHEPELAAQIRSSIQARTQLDSLMLDCKRPPRSLAFEVFAYYTDPNGDHLPNVVIALGNVTFSRGEQSTFGLSTAPIPSQVTIVDLVLKPGAAAAEASADLTEYWTGKDIVLPSVKVH